MAEIASATVGLLDFAINCLGRIQLAKDFERDFAKHQIQLDIMQVRLSRWAEVAGVGKGSETATIVKAGGDPDPSSLDQKARKILEEIQDLFEEANEAADENSQALVTMSPAAGKPLVAGSNSDISVNGPLDPETVLPPSKKRIRASLGKWVKKRMAGVAKTGRSLQWAFYKKESFAQFIEGLSELITSLEELFPQDTREQLQELSKEECEEISPPNLRALQGYAAQCDPHLVDAIKEKLEDGRSGGVQINQSHNIGQTTGIHYGDINGVSNGTGNTLNNYWGRN